MKNWKMERLKNRLLVLLLFMLGTCCCINEEGLALLRFRDRIENDPFGALNSWNNGEIDPCCWSGVKCSDGRVVALNLTDLCLEGTLAPEIGNMVHLKSIILRNNTFSGIVPEEIGELKNLEILDLGCNNFSGLLPYNLENNPSLSTLLLDNNELLLTGLSQITSQVADETLTISAKTLSCSPRKLTQEKGIIRQRMLLQAELDGGNVPPPPNPPPPNPESPSAHLFPSPPPPSPPQPPPSPPQPPPLSSPSSQLNPPKSTEPSPPSPSPPPPVSPEHSIASNKHRKKSSMAMVVGIVVGVSALLLILIILGVYYRRNHISVKPWVTSFSGHLQKAFVSEASPARIAGVPKLKRSELETACEDFSNVIGSSSIGTIYKGTLSGGAEIAVATMAVKYADEWSANLETRFKKKIERLSKVNHKNFVNLVGYCEEEEPFARMLVFEYAPNGTLFEHLHVKEAEHLDWGMRLRIAMGVAYCLEHMHQLNPPYPHTNLNSSAIMLTEDYAAKVSNFIFWNQISASEIETNKSGPIDLLAENSKTQNPERNVYSFGVLLFEIVTARLPYSVDNGSSDDWASDYVRGDRPLRQMVDSSLTSFDLDQVEQIGRVIKFCVHPSPDHRPTMAEVCERLRVITGILPDGAGTKLSSLWWAELEIISTEGV